MLKKLLSAVSALALAAGLTAFSTLAGPALAASADGGSHSAAASGETCVEFSSAQIAAGSPLTAGVVTASFASPDAPWTVSSAGDPLATIQVQSGGVWSDRTGQTTFSGESGAAIDGAWVCTAPAAAPHVQSLAKKPHQPDPTPYVIVAWLMPYWSGDYFTATWPQHLAAYQDVATVDLNVLDPQLTACGTSYQVDAYHDSAVTRSLLAGGVLYVPGTPNEDDVLPSGWGTTFKLVHNPDCLPQDAQATVQVSTPTCAAPGAATFSLSYASWNDTTGPEDQTVGDHARTATASAGHLFSNGLNTITVNYNIPDVLAATGPACYQPVAVKPSYSAIHGCGVYGSITLVDTAFITYAIATGDGKQGLNTVTATAVSPYVLSPSSTSPWVIDLGTYQDCYKPAVTWNVGTCTVVQSSSVEQLAVLFDNTASTVSVTFTIPSASVSQLVTAGATAMVEIPIGTSGSPALDVYADGTLLSTIGAIGPFVGCLPVTVDADPSSAATCAVDGSVSDGAINVDVKPGMVYYTISGGSLPAEITAVGPSTALPPGTYTVTAHAEPGYILSGTSSWVQTIDDPSPCGCDLLQLGKGTSVMVNTHSDAAVHCDPPTLASWQTAATVTQPVCAASNGMLTVGDVGGGVSFFSEVDYFLDGVPLVSPHTSLAPGTYTVTASAHTAGDGLTGPSIFPIKVVAAGIACADLKTLALTGTSPVGWIGLALGLLAAGFVLVATRVARRPRSQN